MKILYRWYIIEESVHKLTIAPTICTVDILYYYTTVYRVVLLICTPCTGIRIYIYLSTNFNDLKVIELAPLAVKLDSSPVTRMSCKFLYTETLGMCTGSNGGRFISGLPANNNRKSELRSNSTKT